MSVVPGVCKKQTNVKGVGGVKSINKNMPTPKEYGRTVLTNGLSALNYGDC